ncbi:hypothetical protein LguiA_015036 [Lonicera macranthoides]
MAPSNNWILSLKFLSVSTAFLSIAMAMKLSIPLIIHFTIHQIPSIWSTLIYFLKPPYLYVLVNFIIITIAASSFLHQKLDDDDQSERLLNSDNFPSDIVILDSPAVYESEPRVLEVKSATVDSVAVVCDGDDGYEISRSTWTPPQSINSPDAQKENRSPVNEKPLVSSRFAHRKPLKASPEGGKALRVAKPKRQETLENTWKAITDGRPMPLTRHLRKSDTWENQGLQINTDDESPQKMKKSETFKDRTNYESINSSPVGSGKLRKEASVSQDELNRRVEAFIKKFNDEMRLQRQESLNQYKLMVHHAR